MDLHGLKQLHQNNHLTKIIDFGLFDGVSHVNIQEKKKRKISEFQKDTSLSVEVLSCMIYKESIVHLRYMYQPPSSFV